MAGLPTTRVPPAETIEKLKEVSTSLPSTALPKDQTVQLISQLNSEIGAFAQYLVDEVNKYDKSKTATPLYFYNGKDPYDLKGNFPAYFDCTYNDKWQTTTCLWDSNLTNMRGILQHLAKMLKRIQLGEGIVENAHRASKGLLAIHTDSSPEKVQTDLATFKSWVDEAKKGTKVPQSFHRFIRKETNDVTLTDGSKAFEPLTNAEIETKVKNWVNGLTGTDKDKLAKVHAEASSLSSQIKANIDQLGSQINTFDLQLSAVPTLYYTEKEEGVAPEFKESISKPFLDELTAQAEENQSDPPKNSSLLGPIILSLVAAGGTFWVLNRRKQ